MSTDGGEAEITIPAGAVAEEVSVEVQVSSVATDPPEGISDTVVVVDVSGVEQLLTPARMAFRLPAAGALRTAQDAGVQVFQRKRPGSPWTVLPSWFEDGQLVTYTMGFSTFLVASVAVEDHFARHEAPGYSLDKHAIDFDNNVPTVEAVVRDFGITGGFLDGRFNGLCFGMAATSFDYYTTGREVPEGRLDSPDVDLFGADGFLNAGKYHSDALANYVLARHTDQLGPNLEFLFSFRNLRDRARINLSHAHHAWASIMLNEEPVILSMTSDTLFSGSAEGHAVLAYAATRTYYAASDTLTYSFDVYDPNTYWHRDADLEADPPVLPAHVQRLSSLEVQVGNYEASRAAGTAFAQTARLGRADDTGAIYECCDTWLLNLYAYYPSGDSASPWSNPALQGLTLSIDGTDLTMIPSWSHPAVDAELSEVVWMIVDPSDNVAASGSAPASPTDRYSIDVSSLPAQDYSLRVMVADAQGNLSNVAQTAIVPNGTSSPTSINVVVAAYDGPGASVSVSAQNPDTRALLNVGTGSVTSAAAETPSRLGASWDAEPPEAALGEASALFGPSITLSDPTVPLSVLYFRVIDQDLAVGEIDARVLGVPRDGDVEANVLYVAARLTVTASFDNQLGGLNVWDAVELNPGWNVLVSRWTTNSSGGLDSTTDVGSLNDASW